MTAVLPSTTEFGPLYFEDFIPPAERGRRRKNIGRVYRLVLSLGISAPRTSRGHKCTSAHVATQVLLIITLSVIFSRKKKRAQFPTQRSLIDRETCKLIWTWCLVAPYPLSTPTLSNLTHCPLSSSDTPHLSLFRTSPSFSFINRGCDRPPPPAATVGTVAQEDPRPPADLPCTPTVTWQRDVSGYVGIGTKPPRDVRSMSDKQAADDFGIGVSAAAI